MKISVGGASRAALQPLFDEALVPLGRQAARNEITAVILSSL